MVHKNWWANLNELNLSCFDSVFAEKFSVTNPESGAYKELIKNQLADGRKSVLLTQ